MNNQRKAIKVIATAAFATFLIALVPALAANGDTSGIGRFITIAYANAGANFASIRGRKAGENADDNETQYYALKWPSKSVFQLCSISSYAADSSFGGLPAHYSYTCDSTWRSDSEDALFAMAQKAVQADLPAGFVLWQTVVAAHMTTWQQSGTTRDIEFFVNVLERSSDHNQHCYELTMQIWAGKRP